MSQIGPPLLIFCLLLAATGVGLFAKSKLHERHRTGEQQQHRVTRSWQSDKRACEFSFTTAAVLETPPAAQASHELPAPNQMTPEIANRSAAHSEWLRWGR